MKRNASDYIVAAAVIVCSLVLLAALTFALSGYQVKKPARTVQVDFADVAGIKLHSEVRYAGAPAGRVIAMTPLTPEERLASPNNKSAVRVTIEVDDRVPPLPADIGVALGSDTLLSEKFVGLSGGTPGAPLLANGALIQAGPASGIDQLAAQAGPLLENANGLLSNVDGMVTGLKRDLNDLVPKLTSLLESIQALSASGQTLIGHADVLIERDLKARLDDLEIVLKQADTALKNADTFIDTTNKFVGSTDRELQQRMRELSVVLQNLKVVATHAKAITETLGEKPSRLIWGSKTNKLTPESTILRSSQPLPATTR